ncbi:ABC transporter permease [Bacillus sp. HMF5848]|uniref:ABC transporter permease n=1 Tax=Bacillus sp. HMF5848 TaxID=2495421 RepID=UPI000F7B598C|nr:ABC transporter permease [Bacillus sp. HMF5848]RSK28400.1 ABC transporter permease [Bacillus sp. HMF5848]
MKTIWTICTHELRILLRSKSIFSFAAIFSILAVTIVYFGSMTAKADFIGFNRMTASLLNLCLFIIPLLTLLIGSTFFSGEKENGLFSLLMTYPISSTQAVVGKFISLLIAIFAVVTFGYGLALIILFISAGNMPLSLFFLFYGFTLLLAMMFLAISIFVGIISSNRFQALGVSIMSWAFFVLFFEFVIMGIASIIPKQAILPMFTASILINPVEIVRVWTIVAMGSGTVFGPSLYDMTIWAEGLVGQIAFASSTILWTILPLLITVLLVKRGAYNGK